MLPAIPAQMATRAGLDVSHASKSITAWREKKPSYKGNLNRICRGTFFITAHFARVVCFSVRSYRAYFLSILGVLVTHLSVGAPPAAEAPLCVFQVLREAICGVDLEGTWCQAGEEDRDEATLVR